MPTLNPGAPAGKVFTSDKSGWALHPLWGNEVDLLYGGDCSVKTSLESGWWVDNMFSGRTEHSLVPFQRGISPHLIRGWKLVELKKSGSWRQNHLFRLCLPGTHPMDHSVCKVKARPGFPGLTLLYLVPYHITIVIVIYCVIYIHVYCMFIIRNVPWGEEACHGAPEDGLEQEQCSPRHNQVICWCKPCWR